MSGRIAYRDFVTGRNLVCDLATGDRTWSEDETSFWAQHAHSQIEIVWRWHNDDGFIRFVHFGSQTDAIRLREARLSIKRRCTPVRWDNAYRGYEFLDLGWE